MKSIFVLCGGYEWKSEKAMNKLCEFITNKFNNPKILDVWFAMEEERYKKYDDIFIEIYQKNGILNERKIATKENFIEECKWADVINIHGGSSILPLNVVVHYGDDKYIEDNANWGDVVMAMTYSPIGFSVVLKEDDIRAFGKDGKEIEI